MPKTIYSGTCKFEIFEDVGKTSGKPYQAIKITIGDYEVSNWILLNNEKLYCIKSALEKVAK